MPGPGVEIPVIAGRWFP